MTPTLFRVSALALAMGCAVPAHAVVDQIDQETREQIDQLMKSFTARFLDEDAAGATTLFTDDSVIISSTPTAVKTGRQEIKQFVQSMIDMSTHLDGKIDKVSPLNDTQDGAVIVLGTYHISGNGAHGRFDTMGNWATVDVRTGETWRIRLLTVVPNPPPIQ
jgi:uncharacterized protein (TIGR02246 family)